MKYPIIKSGLIKWANKASTYVNSELSLFKWLKEMLSYLNVPYVDNCCDVSESVPMRYNKTENYPEIYNPTTKTWDIYQISKRATYRARIYYYFGVIQEIIVFENTLPLGGGYASPIVFLDENYHLIIRYTNSPSFPVSSAHLLFNLDSRSGSNSSVAVRADILSIQPNEIRFIFDKTYNTFGCYLNVEISIPLL